MAVSNAFRLPGGIPAVFALAFALLFMLASVPACAQDAVRAPGLSGLPVPRFASLKPDEVNVRKGPGQDHAVAWVYRRAGLPVEIIAEYDVWRQVRDSEGATGWIYARMLSGRRTVLVAPWVKDGRQTYSLYADESATSTVVARLQPGVLGDVLSCGREWCRLAAGGLKGWLQREHLWGLYPAETLE